MYIHRKIHQKISLNLHISKIALIQDLGYKQEGYTYMYMHLNLKILFLQYIKSMSLITHLS